MDTGKVVNIGEIWPGWETKECIGTGSFGKVYRIIRQEYGHTYESALKVISIPGNKERVSEGKPAGLDFEKVKKDLAGELVLMSKLRGNSNIVSYEDHKVVDHTDGVGCDIYLRMEMLKPLLVHMEENSFTVQDVIWLGIGICQALELCQRYHIIHRDIKPENIFISSQGEYKLGDFGIAKELEKARPGLAPKGTYTYMAPEIYHQKSYDARVDIYSLGIVLYCFLNENKKPFLSENFAQTDLEGPQEADRIRFAGKELPPPCNADEQLAEVVLKACAFDPKERYQSPKEMRKALQEALPVQKEVRYLHLAGNAPGELTLDVLSPDHISLQEMNRNNGTLDVFGDERKEHFGEAGKTGRKESAEESEIEKDTEEGHIEEKDTKEEAGKEEEEDGKVPSGKKKGKYIMTAAGAAAVLIVALISAASDRSMVEKKSAVTAAMFLENNLEETLGTKKLSQVPNVVGMSREEAKSSIEKAGLKAAEKEKYNDTVAAGIVVSQSVDGGKSVFADTKIKIVVSKGAKQEEEKPQDVPLAEDSGSANPKEASTSKPQTNQSQQPENPAEPQQPEPQAEPQEAPEPEPPAEPQETPQPEPTKDPDEEDVLEWDLKN